MHKKRDSEFATGNLVRVKSCETLSTVKIGCGANTSRFMISARWKLQSRLNIHFPTVPAQVNLFNPFCEIELGGSILAIFHSLGTHGFNQSHN